MSREINLEFVGQLLTLNAEKAIYMAVSKTLLIADVHLGKDAVFRRSGLAIPQGDVINSLARLTTLVQHYRVEQLIVLGGFCARGATGE